MFDFINLRTWKIRHRLIFFFMILATVPLIIVGTIAFYISYNNVQDENIRYSKNITNQLAVNINNFVSKYNQKITDISFSSEIQEDYSEMLKLDENEPSQFITLINQRNRIEGYLSSHINNNRYISSISFFPEQINQPFSAGVELPVDNYKLNAKYSSLINSSGEILWDGGTDLFKRTMKRPVISLSSRVVKRGFNIVQGVLTITIYEDELDNIYFSEIPEKGFLQIVDSNGRIISAKDKSTIGSYIDKGVLDYFQGLHGNESETVRTEVDKSLMQLTACRIENSDWFLVYAVPYSYLMQSTYRMLTIIVCIMLGCIIAAIFVSAALSLTISRPIKQMQEKMKEVGNGDFNVRIDTEAGDEVGDLAKGFNKMLKHIRSLIESERKANIEKAEAQFLALQAQVNPHFLYNTLDTVNWMANSIYADNIAYTVTTLSKILRFSLDAESTMTTVRNEMDNLQNYMRIQQQRYNNMLEITIDVDQSILDCPVIKFLFQPIVENSMYHAFEKINKNCKIIITGMGEKGYMVFKVSDNGVGMNEETLLNCLEKPQNSKKSGYALWNIAQRIELCYEGKGIFRVESQLGIGTTVIITIPTDVREDY